MELDQQNGNSKWYDATKLEMDQISEYGVFKDNGRATLDPKTRKVTNAPPGYQKIRVHLVFAVKHDGRYKARLVGGLHLTSRKHLIWHCINQIPQISHLPSQIEKYEGMGI